MADSTLTGIAVELHRCAEAWSFEEFPDLALAYSRMREMVCDLLAQQCCREMGEAAWNHWFWECGQSTEKEENQNA